MEQPESFSVLKEAENNFADTYDFVDIGSFSGAAFTFRCNPPGNSEEGPESYSGLIGVVYIGIARSATDYAVTIYPMGHPHMMHMMRDANGWRIYLNDDDAGFPGELEIYDR